MKTSQTTLLTKARILWAITLKDFTASIKNKNVIALLITSLAVVFAYRALPLLDKEEFIRVLVYDAGNTSLVQSLEQSQALRIYSYDSEERMKYLLADGEMPKLGLVLPAGFEPSLQNGSPLALKAYTQFWVKPEEVAEMKTILQNELKLVTGQEIAIEMEGNLVYPADTQDALGTQASLSVVYLIVMLGLMLIPHLMLEERHSRTMDALLVSPASPGLVVAAKALVGLTYCILGCIAALVVNADVIIQWWPVLLGIVFGALFSVSLGLCLGTLVENRSQLSMLSWVFILPLLLPLFLSLLSDLFPKVVGQVMHVMPTTAMFYISRAAFGTPVNIGPLLIRLAWVGACALVGLWMASRVVDWQAQVAAGETHPVQRLLRRRVQQNPSAEQLPATAEIKIEPDARRAPAAARQYRASNGPLRKIWAIAMKDLREAVHNKLVLSLFLGTAMILLTSGFLPMLLKGQSKPTVVINAAGSSEIIRQLADQTDLRLAAVRSQAELEAILSQSPDVRLGLVIPDNFDMLVSQGADLTLQGHVIHWASEKEVNDLTTFFSERLAQLASRPVNIETAGNSVYPSMDAQGGMNITLVNLVLIAMVLGFALVPLMIIEEKQAHTMEALIVSPASRLQIFLGKSLAGVILCLAALIVAVLAYQHLVVHWTVLVLAVLLSTVFLVTTGLFLGMLCDNPATIGLWGSLILLLMLGLTMVKEILRVNLPPLLADIAIWTPGSLMVDLYGLSMVGPLPLDRVFANAAGLMLLSLVMAGLVVWRLRQMDR